MKSQLTHGARARASAAGPPSAPFSRHHSPELSRVKGSELVGLRYEPMFDYFADREASFAVVEDNYVTNESGTGIVHQVRLNNHAQGEEASYLRKPLDVIVAYLYTGGGSASPSRWIFLCTIACEVLFIEGLVFLFFFNSGRLWSPAGVKQTRWSKLEVCSPSRLNFTVRCIGELQ